MMKTEANQRAEIVAEARKWIGTPYHNCADVRGAGVDCGMLLVRIFVDTGLIAPFDPRPYPPDWHLHRDAERYLESIFDYAGEVETPSLGDIVVFKYGRAFSHGAIVTGLDPITIVHAFQPCECVCEEPMFQNIQLIEPKRRRRYFSVWARGA